MAQATFTPSRTTGFSEQTFRALIDKRSELAWISDLRRRSWDVYAAKPMPALNHEEWRRTDIRSLKLDSFDPADLADSNTVPAPESFAPHLSRGQFAGSILQVDGQHASGALATDLARKGVIFCSMDDAVRQHRELVEPYFMTR